MRTEEEVRERIKDLRIGIAARALCLQSSPESMACLEILEWVLNDKEKEPENG